MPIFRVKSVKIYTGQKKFTRAPLVVLVTNIRYGLNLDTPAEYKKRDFQEHIVVICLPFEKVIGVKELCHVAICHALTS